MMDLMMEEGRTRVGVCRSLMMETSCVRKMLDVAMWERHLCVWI